jgi:hypothetical protein
VRPAGVEPATTSLEGWGSIQLSYGRVSWRDRDIGTYSNGRCRARDLHVLALEHRKRLKPVFIIIVERRVATPCLVTKCHGRWYVLVRHCLINGRR